MLRRQSYAGQSSTSIVPKARANPLMSAIVLNFYDKEDSVRLAEKELAFRRYEREVARKERFRLIKTGRILPAYKMTPQLLVREDGKWKPEIKTCSV